MIQFFSLITLVFLMQEGYLNLDRQGVAIGGYDPVSYFAGKPTAGRSEYSFRFQGASYYFSSSKNLEIFKLTPEKYVPQYGGWCAYAMGETGDQVKIDPETFKITNGKLYLFYNFRGNNTLIPWEQSELPLMEKADENWKTKYLSD
ncbi:MAG: YHS domain-containing (seleno)protein [Marinoscillum sp.]|uniref:YHS domain-containing (seleno)protein n=1 Tax=Marinoscillum sp. TaxID=2024838 RepID=UPI0032FE26D3